MTLLFTVEHKRIRAGASMRQRGRAETQVKGKVKVTLAGSAWNQNHSSPQTRSLGFLLKLRLIFNAGQGALIWPL